MKATAAPAIEHQSSSTALHAGKQGNTAFFGPAAGNEAPFFAPRIQTKLTIGRPGDKYEQEADAVADRVVQRLANPGPPVAVQKKCQDCEEKEKLQRKEEEREEPVVMRQVEDEQEEAPPMQTKAEAGASTSPNLQSRLSSAKGSGAQMDKSTRQPMEAAFGQDFGQVRIHTDGGATQMNRELNARAFTHGRDIYFNAGEYSPGSTEGRRLLAHELVHVGQQGGGVDINKELMSLSAKDQMIQAQYQKRRPPRIVNRPPDSATMAFFAREFSVSASRAKDQIGKAYNLIKEVNETIDEVKRNANIGSEVRKKIKVILISEGEDRVTQAVFAVAKNLFAVGSALRNPTPAGGIGVFVQFMKDIAAWSSAVKSWRRQVTSPDLSDRKLSIIIQGLSNINTRINQIQKSRGISRFIEFNQVLDSIKKEIIYDSNVGRPRIYNSFISIVEGFKLKSKNNEVYSPGDINKIMTEINKASVIINECYIFLLGIEKYAHAMLVGGGKALLTPGFLNTFLAFSRAKKLKRYSFSPIREISIGSAPNGLIRVKNEVYSYLKDKNNTILNQLVNPNTSSIIYSSGSIKYNKPKTLSLNLFKDKYKTYEPMTIYIIPNRKRWVLNNFYPQSNGWWNDPLFGTFLQRINNIYIAEPFRGFMSLKIKSSNENYVDLSFPK